MKKQFLVIMLIFLPFMVFSKDEPENIKKNLYSGLIFNTDNILLDIDSYQSGIGYKFFFNELNSMRLLADIYYSNSSDTFSFTLGSSYIHFFKELNRINPYIGADINCCYLTQSNITDDDNWTKDQTIPISGGAILGVEFFVFDFLSIFAEYNAGITLTIDTNQLCVNGVVTEDPALFSSEIDLRIGNNSSLGLVIYFDEIIDLKKE